MKKFLLVLILALAPLSSPHAETPTEPATHFSAKDKADLDRIENYLNGLQKISADFLQIDDAGGILHGQIAIVRPGKMRVTYDPPNKDFIVADGTFVHIWNDDLQAQTNVEEGTSLAEFILRSPVKLSGDVTVTKVKHLPAKIEITLVQTNDAGAGSLTLVFEDKPLRLRQWKVLDPQGHMTGVNLQNVSEDVTFPADTFMFVPPNFGKKQ